MQTRTQFIILLAAVVLLAIGVRAWGVGFGLPYPYHVDEPAYVSAALNLGAGIIGRQPNPTGYSNILFGEFAGYYLYGRITGMFPSTAAFEQTYRSDPSVFLLLGRLTSVLLGAATVVVVYGLGQRSANRNTGLLAALFLAGSFLHVRDSHYGVPDVPTTFFVGLGVLLCLVAVQTRAKKYVAMASAVSAYAIATKWNVWPVMLPLIVAVLVRMRSRELPARSRAWWSMLILVAVFFFAGFALGGFQLLLKPGAYLEYALREAQAGESGGFGFWQIDTLPGWMFYLKTLVYGVGPVLLVLAAWGLVRRLVMLFKRRDISSLVLIAFPAVYFSIMGATRHYFARYALPLVPFTAVLAADVIVATVACWQPGREKLAMGAAIGIVAVATIPTFVDSVQHDVLLSRTDTRTIAKQWIEANIPAGAKIAIDWPFHGPPLATADQPHTSDVTYDVTLVGHMGLAEHPLGWYQQQGYDYLIASSFIYDIPLVFPDQDMQRNNFYAQLPRQTTLVQEFYPAESKVEPPFIFDEIYGPAISLWQRDRPGPTIKIYRLN